MKATLNRSLKTAIQNLSRIISATGQMQIPLSTVLATWLSNATFLNPLELKLSNVKQGKQGLT